MSTLKMGQSIALKEQRLVDVLYLENILDTFHRFNQCRQTKKPTETEKYDILFATKYTRPLAYIHANL